MADPVKITLSEPITAHGETLSELTFREPRGKDLRESSIDGPGWFEWRMIGACCNIPPSVVDGMPAKDANKLRRQLNLFLADTAAPSSSTATSPPPASGET